MDSKDKIAINRLVSTHKVEGNAQQQYHITYNHDIPDRLIKIATEKMGAEVEGYYTRPLHLQDLHDADAAGTLPTPVDTGEKVYVFPLHRGNDKLMISSIPNMETSISSYNKELVTKVDAELRKMDDLSFIDVDTYDNSALLGLLNKTVNQQSH